MLILKILETLSHNSLAENIGFSLTVLSMAIALSVITIL